MSELAPSLEAAREFLSLLCHLREACSNELAYKIHQARSADRGVKIAHRRFHDSVMRLCGDIHTTLCDVDDKGFRRPRGWGFGFELALAEVESSRWFFQRPFSDEYDGDTPTSTRDIETTEIEITSLSKCISDLEKLIEEVTANAYTIFETVFPSRIAKLDPERGVLISLSKDEAALLKANELLESPTSPPTEPKPIDFAKIALELRQTTRKGNQAHVLELAIGKTYLEAEDVAFHVHGLPRKQKPTKRDKESRDKRIRGNLDRLTASLEGMGIPLLFRLADNKVTWKTRSE